MRGETILIVDDEKLIRWSLRQELTKSGFGVLEAETKNQCFSILSQQDPDLVILDQLLPDGSGIEILQTLKSGVDIPPVIMLTAIDRSDVAVQAMKLGAFDYVTKPVNIDELKIVIDKVLEATTLKRQVARFLKDQQQEHGFLGIVGSSPPVRKVYREITRFAESSGTTILITGESGTGKELAARAIHFLSDRRNQPLMTVNSSALSESLIESELFGHEKGAFTDARTQKKGLFEIAHGGTIVLDEIGDVSPRIQVKLLRVLEQKSFQRVGGTTDINVDVRIIATTNQPLEKLIAEGRFREDLYYRLNVALIAMPPLRERGEDVLLLANYFLSEFNSQFHKQFKGLGDETRRLFLEYSWPGNIRELRNVLERAVLIGEGDIIQPSAVVLPQNQVVHPPPPLVQQEVSPEPGLSLVELEKNALVDALERAGHNQSKAAKLLQISRDTLRYRMKKYKLAAH